MKIRNIISTILLAVYSIVLGHSIVPHHHHFENSEDPGFYCQVEKAQQIEHCCEFTLTDHGHDTHQHLPCNFNEKIVFTKSGNLSLLFLPASSVEIKFSEKEKTFFYVDNAAKISTDQNRRHILLRGPPQLS